MLQPVRMFWRRISSGPREKQALALLRIATGLFFLNEGQHKLTDPQFEAHLLAQLQHWAATNPFPLYRAFLQQWIIPHAHQIANLVTDGQILIGVSYITGFLIPLSAALAIFLNLNFLLAMQHTDPSALGLNLAFLLISLVLFWGKAGSQYGLDRFLTFSLPADNYGRAGGSSSAPSRRTVKPKASIRKPERRPDKAKPDKFKRKAAPAPAPRPANVKKFERPSERSPEQSTKPASAKVRKLEKMLQRETDKQKKQEAPPEKQNLEKREKIQPVPAPVAEEPNMKVVKIFDHRTPDDDD